MTRFLEEVARSYERLIVAPGKQPQVYILVAFILTFLLVRALTHAIRAGRRGLARNVTIGGTHVHHLVPGIVLLLVTGYLAFAFDPRTGREPLALLFGVGAALTLDEFALWLHLKDVYWQREGRRSVDVVIVVATLLGLVLVGRDFWLAIGREAGRLLGGG